MLPSPLEEVGEFFFSRMSRENLSPEGIITTEGLFAGKRGGRRGDAGMNLSGGSSGEGRRSKKRQQQFSLSETEKVERLEEEKALQEKREAAKSRDAAEEVERNGQRDLESSVQSLNQKQRVNLYIKHGGFYNWLLNSKNLLPIYLTLT
jgi:hypothetical protein